MHAGAVLTRSIAAAAAAAAADASDADEDAMLAPLGPIRICCR